MTKLEGQKMAPSLAINDKIAESLNCLKLLFNETTKSLKAKASHSFW